MSYVVGVLIAVPRANREAYAKHSQIVGEVLKECGALSTADCWGDDIPEGAITSFPKAVKCTDEETVVFSWSVWPSRQARDAGIAKSVADPRVQKARQNAPFDEQRLIFGGFEMLVGG